MIVEEKKAARGVKAADKIDRLCADIAECHKQIARQDDDVVASREEAERLRAQNAELALSLDVARGDFHRNAAKLWEPLLKAKEDEIERLRAENEKLRDAVYRGNKTWNGLSEQCATLRARVARLEEALRPFAACTYSEEYIKNAPDHGLCAAISYTAGDYRRARAALGETEA